MEPLLIAAGVFCVFGALCGVRSSMERIARALEAQERKL